jgi:putative ABC transport system permease protein
MIPVASSAPMAKSRGRLGRRQSWWGDWLAELRRAPSQTLDLFRFAAVRLWAKRRLVLGLQVGLIVAATVAATVPLYSNGALTRLLAAALQPQNERPAGAVLLRFLPAQGELFTPSEEQQLATLAAKIGALTGLGATPPAFYAQTGSSSFVPDSASPVPEDPSYQRSGSLDMEVGLSKHIKLLAGHLYSPVTSDGVIDGLISTSTQQNLHMVLGQIWDFPSPVALGAQVRVRIVGIYKRLNPGGPFWPYQYQDADVFIPPQVFLGQFMYNPNYPLEEASWYTILHLGHLSPSAAGNLVNELNRINTEAGQILANTQLAVSPISQLQNFITSLQSMETELLLISLPILALTLYYVVMMAGLAVQQDRNEIAVLVSRGSRTWQIVSLYLAQWLILGGVAFLVAPFPAAFLTELVGASTGFLQFVNRAALPILPSGAMYGYDAAAALVAILAALLPVVVAARQSIVNYRTETTRSLRAPFWRRAYIDFILLAVAAYAWHQFHAGVAGAGSGGALASNPLLFVVPAIFMAGAALFLVRLLPWVIRGLDAIVGRYAPVTLVLTARQLARMPAQFSPLVFLLVFTVGLGYYSASAARTLNLNLADGIAYQVGSDVSMYEVWAPPGAAGLGTTAAAAGLESGGPTQTSTTAAAPAASGTAAGTASSTAASSTSSTGPAIQQFGGVTQAQGTGPGQTTAPVGEVVEEPPFSPNEHLPGVISAARVFLAQAQIVVGGQTWPTDGQLMGIDPVNFYHTAWWRPDLSPFSFVSYMNALLGNYNGVLVQQSFMQAAALQPGDTIQIEMNGVSGEFEVLGPIQYWPGMYPSGGPMLVANWPYIENTFGVLPYYVWFRTRASASDQAMVNALQQDKLFPTQVVDRRVLLGQAHASPSWTGSNGLLTISFLVAALLTFLGYLLYAVLALRNRMLQFGLLRAMGLARAALSTSVVVEQAFLLAAGIAGGLYVGAWTAFLFLPFFQAASGTSVPPFIITGAGSALWRMGILMALLLAVTIIGLLQVLRGLRIGEAVKLGEE